MKKLVFGLSLLITMSIVFSASAFPTKPEDANARFVVTDQVVKDLRTGLIWTRRADLGHLEWEKAQELAMAFKKDKFAGFDDWHLPELKELETLWNFSVKSGYKGQSDTFRPFQLFLTTGFSGVTPDGYWTSTSHPKHPESAYVIDMSSCSIRSADKTEQNSVWLVRGGS